VYTVKEHCAVGGVFAGVVSDYLGGRALTCMVMLLFAAPSVSCCMSNDVSHRDDGQWTVSSVTFFWYNRENLGDYECCMSLWLFEHLRFSLCDDD